MSKLTIILIAVGVVLLWCLMVAIFIALVNGNKDRYPEPQLPVREIGEEFLCGYYRYRVERATKNCEGCSLNYTHEGMPCYKFRHFTGTCNAKLRPDKQDVIFRKVSDETDK